MTDDTKKNGEEIEYLPDEPADSTAAAPPEPPRPEPPPVVEKAEEKTPEPESARTWKAKLRKKEAEIKALKKEKDELQDQFLRKIADFENWRKRIEREKTEYFQFALSETLLELLAVVDNFERALQSPEADGKTFREGVELIYRMFLGLLSKRGVQPIEIKDRRFDPNLHHAMATEESETVEEPEVGEELQKGYLINGRLLRPTLVKVIVPRKT